MSLGIIWKFKTKNFTVMVDYDYEEGQVDRSWADEETLEKLASGEWTAYQFRAVVLDKHGEEIGVDYLGDSIHEDAKDFRDHVGLGIKARQDNCNYGSYFVDMVRNAIAEARQNWNAPRAFLRNV